MANRCFAALCGGLLLPYAFAPFGWWPLAAVALALLIVAADTRQAKAAALVGWCFGLGMFGFGVWWIQVSVHQFGVPYYSFSVTTTAVLVAGMALYPAVYATLLSIIRCRGVAACFVIPSLWVLTELIRASLFTGFPWLSLGYSQIESPVAALAPVLGVYGCSWVVVFVATAAVEILRPSCRKRYPVAATATIVFIAVGILDDVHWTHSLEQDKEVALVQGAVPQALKWRPEMRAPTLALYGSLTEPHWDVDLIIWPETAVPAFPQDVETALDELSARAATENADLVVGLPTGDRFEGGYYNSLMKLDGDRAKYDKRHLVPFGEYFPLKFLYEGLAAALSIPMSDFSRGRADQHSLSVAGHLAGISICYEDVFGNEVIDALPAAGFLINISNDAWFGDTIAPHQHLEIARMRALETGRYLLRGTNTGVTAIIDAKGKIVAKAEQFAETVLVGGFELREGATPYVRFGDFPVLLLSAAFSLFGFMRRARAQRVAQAR